MGRGEGVPLALGSGAGGLGPRHPLPPLSGQCLVVEKDRDTLIEQSLL